MKKYKVQVLKYHDQNFNPTAIVAALQSKTENVFLLDLQKQNKNENFIYLGLNPTAKITYQDGFVITKKSDLTITKTKTDLKTYLEQLLHQYGVTIPDDVPPFFGGLAGYFSYDYARYQIPNFPKVINPLNLADASLLLLNEVVAYDKNARDVYLIKTVSVAKDAHNDLEKLKLQLNNLQNKQVNPEPLVIEEKLHPKFTRTEYYNKIKEITNHIYQGDLFQMILSNPLRGKATGSLLTTYQQLIGTYHFYFKDADFEVTSASPETLLRKQGQHLATFPLAGTRRRGKDQREDQFLEKELAHDSKEIAEHNMLVDLGRNDLGAVSQFGSVKVTEHMKLKHFNKVMHLSSTVESKIAPDKTALDALNAVFPAGTLAGAPKVSAMKIIADLEQEKRGIYGGMFGYLNFNQDSDFAIGIRLAHKKRDVLTVHSGAGIVADSTAKNEYQECFNKSRVIIQALKTATNQEVLNNDSIN
ncbi:hypothetical protein BGL34_06205 [Fructilactobacillus lindneri]|uniref:Anthranilate synthase component 1 n=2 Tax=Fructilactobacillus lindneri TaxID=53444 RepID=A0A0R2JTN8_9LACO|nr:anthranilate synthase component I family protein [Fructilactobacillus lindneri]ANZ57479.1 hypothetical protein AYR60_01110 [Fructilactobacillus lindneri]ANZ58747.1 hypothetical protein AYR59_01110 [Fructilactobacillus lindneri]KRN80464.1 anthranilate synthase [Fructilactobacillus lindneri DSM 20690 = JCM 11027]POG97823.1 hypothetical protein BGL31_05670 [Fructilactobacillus lindneri]POG99156.1 hypothetical protein BGL32_05695 [Fructilactobacillus lindneri]